MRSKHLKEAEVPDFYLYEEELRYEIWTGRHKG